MEPFTLVFWNARSIRSSLSEFKLFLYYSKPHLAVICESWLSPADKIRFVGYDFFRIDRLNRQGGGLLVLFRSDFPCRQLFLRPFPNGVLEVIACRFRLLHSEVTLFGAYNPGGVVSALEFDYYVAQAPGPLLLCGDFNAKHRFWCDRPP